VDRVDDRRAPAAPAANLFSFCEGNGIVYTPYFEYRKASIYIALRSSSDDGVTWSTSSIAVSVDPEIPAAVDVNCVANGDDVWIMYSTTDSLPTTQDELSPSRRIRVAHSGDRGQTFDGWLDALDGHASALGLMPVLVRGPQGTLIVSYVAGNADGDTNGSMRFVRTSGGSFGASELVDGPLLFTGARGGDGCSRKNDGIHAGNSLRNRASAPHQTRSIHASVPYRSRIVRVGDPVIYSSARNEARPLAGISGAPGGLRSRTRGTEGACPRARPQVPSVLVH
jgi:hypothetical protein